VHFTNFVIHAGIEKYALGRSSFTGVNVSGDTDIAVALNGCMASHDGSLVDRGYMSSIRYPHNAA
jgi:hypothetical protein